MGSTGPNTQTTCHYGTIVCGWMDGWSFLCPYKSQLSRGYIITITINETCMKQRVTSGISTSTEGSLAAKATYCQQCTEAGKNLKSLLLKGDMGKVPEPREPNECIQLDFWGPINYLNESKKYVLVATDRFSRWPSAMVTTTNTSDKS